jgi:hypothetical protein
MLLLVDRAIVTVAVAGSLSQIDIRNSHHLHHG